MIQCTECFWSGSRDELVAATDDVDDLDFKFCPDCGNSGFEDEEDEESEHEYA